MFSNLLTVERPRLSPGRVVQRRTVPIALPLVVLDVYEVSGEVRIGLFVANNPINQVDPLGLWQFTIGGGWLGGLLITFGNNGGSNWHNGQWNTGVYGGEGGGLYWDFNASDSGCHNKGIDPGWKAKGGLGDVLNAEYNAEGDLYEISGSVSHSYEGTGMDVNYGFTLNGEGLSSEGPSLTPTSGWGAGEFVGIGGTIYW